VISASDNRLKNIVVALGWWEICCRAGPD